LLTDHVAIWKLNSSGLFAGKWLQQGYGELSEARHPSCQPSMLL